MQLRRSIVQTFGVFAVVAVVLSVGAAPVAEAQAQRVRIHQGPVAFLGVSSSSHQDGARVIHVVRGSAADEAGIRQGDIIVEFDGRHWEEAYARMRPGR